MAKMDWDIVTSYIDQAGTTNKTVSFPKAQDTVRVTNKGNVNLVYTIGTKTGTLAPNGTIQVSETISSFTIRAESGAGEFEVRATEAGTEKEETGTLDLSSISAQLASKVSKGELVVNVKDFGAKGDGTTDDTTAIQNAINSVGLKGTIIFPPGNYRTTAPLVFPTDGQGIRLFSLANSVIKADHNGDCIVLTALNENYSGHILEGLTIQGPNASYPESGYTPPSTGAGVKMDVSYYCVIRDCRIQGFNFGVYLKTGIKNNFEGNTYIRFNQYGVYFDGGATNVNHFKGISIRNNRKVGVYFKSGTTPFPSHNIFDGCLIESNIPYPTISGGNAPNDSIGIYIGGGYSNIFNNCYSENHQYAVWIAGSSDGNKFNKFRFSPSLDNSRQDRIMLDGSAVNNTTFNECFTASFDNISPSVESNDANQLYNQFIDCEGFNFISASILSKIDVINLRPNQSGYGTPFGGIIMPSYGYLNNPGEGTTRGKINGIGTTNATLNADGYGEIILGSLITGATTITNIANLKRGQYFTLSNYQTGYPVTIKSSTDGINGLVLKDKKDAVLSGYSDSITFYVTGLWKIIEIARNINKNWSNHGNGNILAGATTQVINHGLSGTPTNIQVTVRGNVGNVWVTSINATSFTVNCTTAPAGATGFSWMAEL